MQGPLYQVHVCGKDQNAQNTGTHRTNVLFILGKNGQLEAIISVDADEDFKLNRIRFCPQ